VEAEGDFAQHVGEQVNTTVFKNSISGLPKQQGTRYTRSVGLTTPFNLDEEELLATTPSIGRSSRASGLDRGKLEIGGGEEYLPIFMN